MQRLLAIPFAVAVMCAASVCAQEKPSGPAGKAERPPEAKQAEVSARAGEAESDGDRVTTPDGKTYIVRETPFGKVRVPEAAKTGAVDEHEPPPDMRAKEDGESVRFERMTPFGVVKWVRKKAELTETERRAWERDRQKAVAPPAAKKKEVE